MTACTSPVSIERSTPLTISVPSSIATWRFLISRSAKLRVSPFRVREKRYCFLPSGMDKIKSHPVVRDEAEMRVHRALSDPSRVRILEKLRAAGGSLDAAAIADRGGLHASTGRPHPRGLAGGG